MTRLRQLAMRPWGVTCCTLGQSGSDDLQQDILEEDHDASYSIGPRKILYERGVSR